MADVGQAIEARLSAASVAGSTGTIDPAALVRLEEAAANGASLLSCTENWVLPHFDIGGEFDGVLTIEE